MSYDEIYGEYFRENFLDKKEFEHFCREIVKFDQLFRIVLLQIHFESVSC
jgi:hypothetical protein